MLLMHGLPRPLHLCITCTACCLPAAFAGNFAALDPAVKAAQARQALLASQVGHTCVVV